MHLPLTKETKIPLIFNVDVVVGLSAGKQEDVLLVQFLLFKAAQGNSSGYSAGTRQLLARVPLTGVCDRRTD